MASTLSKRVVGSSIAIGLLIIGGAIAVGYMQCTTSRAAVALQSLARIQRMQRFVIAQKQTHQAELAAVLAADPHFSAYIVQALDTSTGNAPDVVSIQDLLTQRQQQLGFDALAVVDGNQQVVAAAGDAVAKGLDLAKAGFPRPAEDATGPAVGLLIDGSRRVWATLLPLRPGSSPARLLVAMRIDAKTMKDIATSSDADIAIANIGAGHYRLLASSVDAEHEAALTAMLDNHAAAAPGVGGTAWATGDMQWLPAALPATPANGPVYLSGLRASAAEAASVGVLMPLLAGTIGLLVLLAVLTAVALRRVAAPLANLLMLSERAVKGDYDMVYRPKSNGTIDALGAVFNHLLNDLRQFRPMPGAPRRRSTDRK